MGNNDARGRGKVGRSVRFGAAVVRVYQRGDGKWAIKWREAGRARGTTRTKETGAMEFARATARRIDGAQGRRWVAAEEVELVEKIRRLAGNRSGHLVLDELGELLEAAGGWDGLKRAVGFFGSMTSAEGSQGGRTLGELYDRVEAEYRAHRRDVTWKVMRTELKAICEEHRDLPLAAITPEMVEGWCSRGVPAARTYNNRRSRWAAVLARARVLGWLDRNLRTAAEVVPKRREERRSPSVWSVEQGEAILDLLWERSRDLVRYFALQCWAGLRPSEALGLRLADIDSHAGYVHVRPEVATKLGLERFVPIQPNLRAILDALPGDAGELVASNRSGVWRARDVERLRVYAAPLRAERRLSLLVREAGIVGEWPRDVCRHSFCTYRLAETQDIGRVAEEAGNSPAIIRRHYRRPVPSEMGAQWFGIGFDSGGGK